MSTVQKLFETGMGYTIVSITLKDGRRRFNQAIINSGYLTRVRGLPNVPFSEDDIAEIKATHDKWDWTEKP
jgi:hypothetical protein